MQDFWLKKKQDGDKSPIIGCKLSFLIQEQFNFGFKRWFHVWKFFLTCQMMDTIVETPVEDNPDGFDTISVVVFVVHVVHGFCVFSVKGKVICGGLTPAN